jgi:serine/threonine-protein kinase HipA
MEFISLKLLKKILGNEKISDCELKLTNFGSHQYLISKRDDRENINNEIIKIHQEDFCQTLGLKSKNDDGTYASKIINFLRNYSSNKEEDINTFVSLLFLSYILLNPDLHAKNISIIIKENNFRLAPIYDFASYAQYNKH